jgi:O-methyltransferase
MRIACIGFVVIALAGSLTAQSKPSGTLTPEIEAVLKSIKAADKGQLAVSEEDGRFLRVLVASRGAKSILEIGGASGYSGIWLGLGARESGGRVVTIEYDAGRAKEATENVKRSGLRSRLSPAQSRRHLRRPQRREQEERDGTVPAHRADAPRSVHDDRLAVRRGDVGVVQDQVTQHSKVKRQNYFASF